jgi:hypothetical protein
MRRKQAQRGHREKLVIIAVVLVLVIVALALVSRHQTQVDAATGADQRKFTAYDMHLAMKLLDKDHDGQSDCCGADLEEFIAEEEMELPLPDGTVIGVLDKTKKKHHIHADFKVMLDGHMLDFSDQQYFVKSAFIHVEDDHKPGTGEVLHMHAEHVPLWLFFESVGMNFDKNCFATNSTTKFCTSGNKKIFFYVLVIIQRNIIAIINLCFNLVNPFHNKFFGHFCILGHHTTIL